MASNVSVDADAMLKELIGEDYYQCFFAYEFVPELEPEPKPVNKAHECPALPSSTPAPPSLALDDNELERFVDAQRSANTKCKTKSDIR